MRLLYAAGCNFLVHGPGLDGQIDLPQPIGACYAGRDAFEYAVFRAVAVSSDAVLPQAFAAQRRHRSLDGLTRVLRQLPAL